MKPPIAPLAVTLSLVLWGMEARAEEALAGRDRASIEAVRNLEAYAAYKMGQYEAARDIWQALAASGNTTAMINLANLSGQGQGQPRDLAAALEWTRRAAEAGDSRAQVELGMAYETGHGLPHDNRQAAAWFRKAAEQGDRDGAFNLGVMLATAYGAGPAVSTPDQRREARHWLAEAAVAGKIEARSYLGVLDGGGR